MSYDNSLQDGLSEMRDSWGWMVALGIGLLLAGVAAILVPIFATAGVVTVLGILLLVAGLAQIVSTFHCGHWKGVLVHLLVAILYLVTGFLVLENPVAGMKGLTLLLAAFFLATGLIRVVVSLKERFHGWGWVLMSGAITALLGIIIWRHPESSLWVIGLLVGIDLVFAGCAWIMLGFEARKIPKELPPAPM